MLKRHLSTYLLIFAAAAALAMPLSAQFARAPEVYSITQVNNIFGPGMLMKISRDGSKAVIDNTTPAAQPGGKATHMRSLYDLAAHTNVSWDADAAKPECGNGKWGGDWGDPFVMAKGLTEDIGPKHLKPTGTETVNSVATSIYDIDMGADGKAKIWVEPKYGLVMRAQVAAGNEPMKTLIETREFSLAKPPASIFAAPAGCSLNPPPPPDPDAPRIAAETGEPATDFVMATRGEATPDTCTVLFRIVQKGSMTTVPGGYQIGIDRDSTGVQTNDYAFGPDANGHMIVRGGHLADMTSQVKNGVLRIDNPGKQMHVVIRLPNGGAETNVIRHCTGPQTTLLMVITSLDQMGKGADYLWVKSGKQAGH